MARLQATVNQIPQIAQAAPVGALFVFRSHNTLDSYSTHMVAEYDEFADVFLEKQVPLYEVFVEAPDLKYLVFSVPTLLWIVEASHSGFSVGTKTEPAVNIIMRLVGTVHQKKLQAEAERVLDELLSPLQASSDVQGQDE